MSSDWWLNNIGSFAAASTPSGSIPQYGVAYDVGTAAWPNAQSAQDFVSATARRTHSRDAAALEAAKQQDDEGWFQKGIGLLGHNLKEGVGFIARGPFQDLPDDEDEAHALLSQAGGKTLHDLGELPVVKQAGQAYNFASNVLETPLLMDRNTGMTGDLGLWLDKSAWGKAWQEADDRSIGQAFIEAIVTGKGTTEADLDRMRRTNSLYGLASFATDLYAGAKLDPTVLGTKALGEVRRLRSGELPAESSRLRSEAQRVAQGYDPVKSLNPLTRYASYRGKRINYRFDDLRDFAQNHSLTDMTALPMFRSKAVNGAQAALAFKLAAKDDTLWDLTQRAVLADPVAWKQIGELKHSVPDDLKAYSPADTRTYLDAIDATKTSMKQMESEVGDLEKLIAQREGTPNADIGNVGMFRHHTWELHRDLEAKKADIDEVAKRLEGHQDYGDWLGSLPHVYGDDVYRGPVVSLDQVSTRGIPQQLDYLHQHTYQKSAYGAVHQVNQIAKGAWMMKANPIDLHRVDSGVMSIRRQFEQFDHLMGYKNREGLDAAIESFVRAPDPFTRFKVAKQIEDEHLIGAVSQKFGLAPETVDLFLNETRLRQNEMTNALLSGEGAVYSTGSLMDRATILKRDNGMAEIEVMDNGKRVTMRVPEEALEPQTMPVDPTQTPNNYMPMDTRQVYLAVKRNNELFEALDQDVRQFGAKRTAGTMKAINSAGTAFNKLWKPVQLFRLAWPQRVIMDEGLRSLALVGSSMFARNFIPAMKDASLNALNPMEHGYFLAKQRGKFKAGPGPITDGVFGKNIDTAAHEAEAEFAPIVPSYFAPQRNNGRAEILGRQVTENAEAKRIRDRHAALAREGTLHDEVTPDFNSPLLPRLHEIAGPEGANVGTFDPITGKQTQSGWAVPVYEAPLRDTDDSLLYFIEQHQELLASNGYRVTLENTPNGRVAKVVRVFRKNDVQKASDFASHVEGDMIDVESGHNVFRREHGPETGPVVEEETPDLGSFDDPEFPDKLNAWAERKHAKRQKFGKGTETWKSGDGKKITVNAAFEGPAEIYTNLISSNPVYTRLTDTYKRTLSKYRERAAGYKATTPPDMSAEALKVSSGRKAAVEYLEAWSGLLNDQIRNSPIWVRMLKGQSDDEILRWLTSTDEGARLRREMPHMGHRPEKWVEEHRQRLNAYLPDRNLQAIAAERAIRPDELRRIPAELQPTIYEPDLQMISGRGEVGKMMSDMVDKIYHALGTVPSDLLVRQPFFKSLYDLKMRNLIKATDSEHLSNDVLRGYEKLAREFALRQVRKNLYDLADETNFTQAARFVAPFWGAQQEAMTKWLGIALEKPETVAKFYVGVNETYEHFQVIDEDGKPTNRPGNIFNYNPNDRVLFQIPESWRKHEPFKTLLGNGAFSTLGVSFGAANTALQGDMPLMPSLGPIVTMPADKFANLLWDTHGTQFDDNDIYRWLFPVGRPKGGIGGTLEQLFPGYGRRLSALAQGENSRSYANTFASVWREMDYDARENHRKPPTLDEVKKATMFHFFLRTIASFGAPAAMEFRPKNQFFLDKYHEMQETYGPEAFEQFVKKYGKEANGFAAAYYAASSSSSPVGVPPTSKAMEEWSQNKALIQEFPDWGGAIVSPDAWADDFSSDAYNAQFDIKQGPGTNKRLREATDPITRMTDTETRLGWLAYRQLSASVDAELSARGLHSIQQVGAEDIQAWKRDEVARLTDKYPSWATDYNTFENTIYQKVGQLEDFAFLPQFDNRPDMQGVRQYLMLRRATAQSLDNYFQETGGSRSLQAQENTQLRDWFGAQVGELIQQNPAFGEFYHRYLESDRLERGSG